MKKGVFITAVDTEVGKTLCACALAECLTESGLDVGVYKPVLSGAFIENGVLVPEDAVMLKSASKSGDDISLINPYCFASAVTPAHAACVESVAIDKKALVENYETISSRHDVTIVEGAGGLMVPITDDYLIVDLIRDLGVPALVITDTALGRINHTLMTLKVLKSYGIGVLGVIVNRYPVKPKESDISFIKYIRLFDETEVLGVVPEIEPGEKFYKKFVSSFKYNVDTSLFEKDGA